MSVNFSDFYSSNQPGASGTDFFSGLNINSPELFSMPGTGSIIPQNGGWMDTLKNSSFGQSVGKGWDWLGDNKETINGVGSGLATLFKMYAGWKSLGLQEDAFDFSKKDANRKWGAAVQDYENSLRDRWSGKQAWSEMGGKPMAQTEQQFVDQRSIAG